MNQNYEMTLCLMLTEESANVICWYICYHDSLYWLDVHQQRIGHELVKKRATGLLRCGKSVLNLAYLSPARGFSCFKESNSLVHRCRCAEFGCMYSRSLLLHLMLWLILLVGYSFYILLFVRALAQQTTLPHRSHFIV